MSPSTVTATSNTRTENEGVRRRSLSGASALLARRFTRQSSAPRPTASRSESTARRRATIASSTNLLQQELDDIKVHVRIVPNIENPSRSLIFDIVDRELDVGSVIRIGRYSERHANLNCMSFKSKVVSRCHCEVWAETDGKLYIRDTKSSSGTFLNHVRLSPAGNESRPVELNDGDIVQLGVDFQGGREEMYRSVKMRFELNRSSRPRPLSFNLNAFQNLRNLTQNSNHHHNTATTEESNNVLIPPTEEDESNNNTNNNNVQSNIATTNTTTTTTLQNTTNNIINSTLCTTSPPACNDNNNHNNDIDECCICLYALAPFQALFVSPCSHTYHFKCIRPLLQSYPGFQCPICRTYSDLEASVAIEADEVMEKYDITYNNRSTVIIDDTTANAPPADSGLGLQSNQSSDINHQSLDEDDDDDDNDDDDENQPLAALDLSTTNNNATSASSSSASTDEEEEVDEHSHNIPPLHVSDPYSTTFVSSPVIYSEIIPDSSPLDNSNNHHSNLPTDILHHVIEESSLTNDFLEDNGVMSNTEEEDDDDDDTNMIANTTTTTNTTATSTRPRERRTSHIMEKIKMVFFEKRKSVSTTAGNNKNRYSNSKTRQRPLSYPNILTNVTTDDNTITQQQGNSSNNNTGEGSANNDSSSTPLSQTLSRQSTTHLTEIDEEVIVDPSSYHINNRERTSCIQPMIVDG